MQPNYFLPNRFAQRRNEDINEISISVDSTYFQVDENEDDLELLSQQSERYISSKKELYNTLLEFLENFDDNDDDFQDLIKIINTQQYAKNKEEFEHFLLMIHHISNHHCRERTFFEKIFTNNIIL